MTARQTDPRTLPGSSTSGFRKNVSMRPHSSVSCLLLVCWLCGLAWAQPGSSSSAGEGVSSLGYTVHQSIEAGYRFADQTGANAMFNTLVNLHDGPRILEQTLSMESETHEAPLFDSLYFSSFGWGGDPNNALRARLSKNKWYNFQASFRRDQNFFNYNLLDNPLNPPTSTPAIAVADSPHGFQTRRRMTSLELTLLPQSRLSFRLGYERNRMEGPSFSSFHEGTDVLLFQPWNTTLNAYRLGADLKVLPRTVLSYDQVLEYYKGDTGWQLAPFVPAALPNGAGSVELGLPINTAANQPCAVRPPNTSLIDNSGVLTNLACSAYFDYSRSQRVRTSMPTERLSLRSTYFRRLDLSASFAYSSADMKTPYEELFDGLVSRTRTRAFAISGPARATRIGNLGDVGATLRLNRRFRLINTFRYYAYRIAESFDMTEVANVVPGSGTCSPPSCSLLIPLSGTTVTTTNELSERAFRQNLKRNQTELAWDISRYLGARLGYRYGDRTYDHVLDFATADRDRIVVHEHTALLGLWARPVQQVRFSFDWERVNNTAAVTRISPRKESRYRLQGSYAPRPWAVVGGSINLLEDSNADALAGYRGHFRNYGFNSSFTPKERFGLDLAYNFNDVLQNALICFNDTPPAGVVLPVVTNAGSCAVLDAANPLLTDSYYLNNTHFGMASVMFRPVKRLTTRVGYSLTSVDGKRPQFNILQPDGSLRYNYHQPLASLSLDLSHNLTWNTAWNYYQYGEKSFVGPTSPRYFHANTATLSLRWAF